MYTHLLLLLHFDTMLCRRYLELSTTTTFDAYGILLPLLTPLLAVTISAPVFAIQLHLLPFNAI
jgi:hypothetical protein